MDRCLANDGLLRKQKLETWTENWVAFWRETTTRSHLFMIYIHFVCSILYRYKYQVAGVLVKGSQANKASYNQLTTTFNIHHTFHSPSESWAVLPSLTTKRLIWLLLWIQFYNFHLVCCFLLWSFYIYFFFCFKKWFFGFWVIKNLLPWEFFWSGFFKYS